MTRIVFRLMTIIAGVCGGLVLLLPLVGQLLPQEDEIVFSANLDDTDAEIYRMGLERQLAVALTHNSTEENQPTWSPDGQQIAFVSNRQGQYTIYVMDSLGRGSHRLTESVQNNFSPTWSPDNQAIAYVTSRQEFSRTVSEVLLTDLRSGITRRMTIPYPNAISPSWAPDSRHLVFTSGRAGGANRTIYNLDVQTGDTSPLIAKHNVQLSPTWSPDGRYLLYLAYDNNPGMYVWDAMQVKSLLLFTPEVLNMRSVSWSQDNRYIIYAPLTNSGPNSILRLDMSACLQQRSTCTPAPLTHKIGFYDSPRWRPRTS